MRKRFARADEHCGISRVDLSDGEERKRDEKVRKRGEKPEGRERSAMG
jgi:hypothetical protein